MNIYLIRHGKAENITIYKRDDERELLPEGKEEMRKAALYWKKVIGQFDYIISSPFSRALQTAEIIKEVFDYKEDLIFESFLAHGGSVSKLIETANIYHSKNIAFVGHEPTLSKYVSQLTSNSGVSIDFKKGMIAKISFGSRAREGAGCLDFLIPPIFFK
ncbi:MAG: phosphohistidine phosphatase SixA [Ignavibacteria bacterium]|jgi:phosphohistidine phosphatase|nr:phosphohistidine phosphatase SixA [Ignavibacteria bacterium]MDP3832059.1 phosphohistidine phosphatase SixA [Ignavibacteriaceae bacterium]